jgi:hypothetical protein
MITPLGHIGKLAEGSRCAARLVTPGSDAYEYNGNTVVKFSNGGVP